MVGKGKREGRTSALRFGIHSYPVNARCKTRKKEDDKLAEFVKIRRKRRKNKRKIMKNKIRVERGG